MKREFYEEQISEDKYSVNAAYILKNNEMYYDIGFRVLKNQDDGALLVCHKLKYNGKIKLIYFTENLISIEQYLRKIDANGIGGIIAGLAIAIEEVRNNGFLNIACIDTRLDRIFVDRTLNTIKLIYVPLNIPASSVGNIAFENEIRGQLIKMMQDICMAGNSTVQSIVDVLKDEAIGLADIPRKLKIDKPIALKPVIKNPVFTSMDGKIQIPITKEEFLIGKNEEKVDGVIHGNSAISRVHCKLKKQNGQFSIVDMNSANGTYVNDMRITSEHFVEIENGTKIRLANMEFVIRG